MALSLAWSQKKPCEKFNLKMLKIMMKPIVNSIGLQNWRVNFFWVTTVNTVLMAAALIQFDENFAQDLLSKNHVLLRLLIKCGSYKSAATNTAYVYVSNFITKGI